MSLFLIENVPKGIVHVKNEERGAVGFFVEIVHCLSQELVMETNEGVFTFVALLKGELGSASREAPQWLQCTRRYFPHSQVMDAFQVHLHLVHNPSNEDWKSRSRAVGGNVIRVVIACKTDKRNRSFQGPLGVDRVIEKLLQEIDLGCHVWLRSWRVENTGSSISKVQPVLETTTQFFPVSVGHRCLNPQVPSDEISQNTTIRETASRFPRECNSIRKFPGTCQSFPVVPCISVGIPEHKQHLGSETKGPHP